MSSRTTKGAIALREIVAPPRIDQEGVAGACQVTQQAVSAWIKGRAKPTPDRMRILQDRFGIPMESWTEYVEDAQEQAASTPAKAS